MKSHGTEFDDFPLGAHHCRPAAIGKGLQFGQTRSSGLLRRGLGADLTMQAESTLSTCDMVAGMNRPLPANAMLLPCTHYETAAIGHRDVTRSRNNGDLRVLTLVKLCLFITVSSASASASKNTVTFFLNPSLTLAGCDQSRRAMERQAWAMLASEPDSLRRKIKGPVCHIALAAHAIEL